MDNGNKGLRPEMLVIMKTYLQRIYPGWNEDELTYNKWKEMEECLQEQTN